MNLILHPTLLRKNLERIITLSLKNFIKPIFFHKMTKGLLNVRN